MTKKEMIEEYFKDHGEYPKPQKSKGFEYVAEGGFNDILYFYNGVLYKGTGVWSEKKEKTTLYTKWGKIAIEDME